MLSHNWGRLVERLQQFLLGDCGGAALHHHYAACMVCQVSSLFGGCTGSESSSKSCDDGIAGSGHIGDFITATDWNIHRLVTARENHHAIFATGDEQRLQIHLACNLVSGGQEAFPVITDADAESFLDLRL